MVAYIYAQVYILFLVFICVPPTLYERAANGETAGMLYSPMQKLTSSNVTNEALEGGEGVFPVSHIPLIILKNIPYPLNKYGKYSENSESIVSPYP